MAIIKIILYLIWIVLGIITIYCGLSAKTDNTFFPLVARTGILVSGMMMMFVALWSLAMEVWFLSY